MKIGNLGIWGGGVNYLVYHAPSSLEFKFQNLGTVRGAWIFCYITPLPSLESQLWTLGTGGVRHKFLLYRLHLKGRLHFWDYPKSLVCLSHDDSPFPGLSPNFIMMVSHLSFDSHPPSTGWLHNLLRLIFPSMVTNISRMIAHLPFLGWSLTFPRMVTNLPNDGQPPFLGWATRFNFS